MKCGKGNIFTPYYQLVPNKMFMKTSKQLKHHLFYVDGVVKGDILNTCKWSSRNSSVCLTTIDLMFKRIRGPGMYDITVHITE